MFVLDTNTIIYLLKKRERVVENFRVVHPKSIFVPAVVFYELQVHLAKTGFPPKKVKQLDELIERLNLAAFDDRAAIAASVVRAKLEMQGRPIGPIDTLIAGTALSLEATLVTHNVGEFSRVEGLEIVDWL